MTDLIAELEAAEEGSRCQRCVEWELMGLSATCPSCDAANNERLRTLPNGESND